LPEITNNKSKIVLFQDNTGIFFTNPKLLAFTNEINMVYNYINDWFNANLSLNRDKTSFTQFSTKNTSLTNLNITHNDKEMFNISNMILFLE
jgi:hypothetical protein